MSAGTAPVIIRNLPNGALPIADGQRMARDIYAPEHEGIRSPRERKVVMSEDDMNRIDQKLAELQRQRTCHVKKLSALDPDRNTHDVASVLMLIDEVNARLIRLSVAHYAVESQPAAIGRVA
ncbi:MAG: hypothetical protein ACR2PG_22025 [Hyphomicrobiaceae bacterium]